MEENVRLNKIEADIDKLKKKPIDTTAGVARILSRMLGVSFTRVGPGLVSNFKEVRGYKLPLTLLDVDFDKTPGYIVTENGTWTKKINEAGNVIPVPYYMLAEQVSRIMRHLNLSDDNIVTLEQADITAKETPQVRRTIKNAKILLTKRDKGEITLLPSFNKEAREKQIQRQERIISGIKMPVIRLDMGVELSDDVQEVVDQVYTSDNNNNVEPERKKPKRDVTIARADIGGPSLLIDDESDLASELLGNMNKDSTELAVETEGITDFGFNVPDFDAIF